MFQRRNGRRVTPSPRYPGERAGERGEGASAEVILRSSLMSLGCVAALCLALIAAAADEPLPGRPDSPPPKPDDRGPGLGPLPFGPPPFALLEALDADRDGKLSPAEIKAAVTSLKKLDKNKDGKLDAEELGWPPRFPGAPGGGGPFGGGPPGGRGFPFGASDRSLAQRIMARDANGDGQVAKDELPKAMHFLIQRGDQDHDAALDANEVQRLVEELGLDAATGRDAKGAGWRP
jgi:hypothetical protein